MSRLPSIGTEISTSWYAVNVPLQVNVLGLITLDYKGGIKVRVESDQEPGRSVNLRVIGQEVSADSPVLGKVTLSQPDADVAPLSLLEDLGDRFRLTIRLDYKMTVEKPPGGGPPLVLTNTTTAAVVGDMPVYPPQGAIVQLQRPVDFAAGSDPNQQRPIYSGQVVAQLLQMAFTISYNP